MGRVGLLDALDKSGDRFHKAISQIIKSCDTELELRRARKTFAGVIAQFETRIAIENMAEHGNRQSKAVAIAWLNAPRHYRGEIESNFKQLIENYKEF